MDLLSQFENDGYAVVEGIVDSIRCDQLIDVLPAIKNSGSRTLLAQTDFRLLAEELRTSASLACLLSSLVAIGCTLFRKSKNHNWGVQLHRDEVIPVQGNGPWESAGEKEGLQTAKPPHAFLNQCVAVRLQLDGAPHEDISVIPSSHQLDASQSNHELHREAAVPVAVPRAGALIMRPLLVHGSSRLSHSEQRRVLHYVFAPSTLPDNYCWYDAV